MDKVDLRQVNEGVIFGHQIKCQTKEARWLRFDDIYQKFYRPNPYDVGGTYNGSLKEYWFCYRTEQVDSHFLLHLYFCNLQVKTVNIALSCNSQITMGSKTSDTAFLASPLKLCVITDVEKQKDSYITTYHFREQDVESLVDKKLYISIRLINSGKNENLKMEIKAKHDFGALLTDPVGADFTIESIEGDKFKFHKSVLAVQSVVFSAMLKGNTAENQNNYVALNDVGTEELQCMQQYVYTGAVSNEANWENLLVLADKYELCGLRLLAEQWLAVDMTLDNALELLVIGDTYNSNFLKQEALKFIKKNAKVMDLADYKLVQGQELWRELCLYIAS